MMIHSEYLVLKVPEAVIIHSLIPYHKVILCYGISLRIACRLLRQDCAVTENKMPLSGEIVENNTPFPPLIICRLTIFTFCLIYLFPPSASRDQQQTLPYGHLSAFSVAETHTAATWYISGLSSVVSRMKPCRSHPLRLS